MRTHLNERLTAPSVNELGYPEPPVATAPPSSAPLSGESSAASGFLFILLGFLVTLGVSIVMSHGRILWEDEILASLLLRDSSWGHMLAGWRNGMDGGGILFYLSARLWFRIFGASVLAFRLYTAVGFGLAFAFVWAAGRRFYRPGIIAFAILLTWFGSPIPVQAMSPGRFYGLLLAADAVAVYLFVRLADAVRVPGRFYLYVFLAHACLVTSHILGICYSSMIVLAMIVQDCTKKRWRPWLYLAAVLPYLLLIPCLPAIKASAAVGKPHYWTVQPTLLQLAADYSGFSIKLGALLLLAIAGVALASRSPAVRSAIASGATRRPVYIYTAMIFLVPLLLFLEGFFGPALCVPRYLLPVGVGTTFMIAEITTLLRAGLPQRLRDNATGAVLLTVFLAGILAYDFLYLRHYNNGLQNDFTEKLTAQLPKGIPIVCEDGFTFTELIWLQHNSGVAYTFLLDWKNATAPQAPRVEVTQYHLMQNMRRQGYFSRSIEDRDAFQRKTGLFYTVSFIDFSQLNPFKPAEPVERYPEMGNPLHLEFAQTSGYRVDLYKVVPLGELMAKVWRICRIGSGECQ